MVTTKIDRLGEGLVVKNYTAMCDLLEVSPAKGKSKQLQDKEWQRYFKYSKSGHKYIIEEIYSQPLSKIDKRKDKMKSSNNAVYVKLIEYLLVNELLSSPRYTNTYTKTNLCKLLGMINQNYIIKKNDIYEDTISPSEFENEISDIPNWMINQFFSRSEQKFSEILFSALNSLKRRMIIMYSEEITIVQTDKSGNKIHKLATDEEKKYLLASQQKVMESMGIDRIPFSMKKIIEFYKQVNLILRNEHGWDYAYKEYKLIYNPEYFPYILPKLECELKELARKCSDDLNNKIIDVLNKQAKSLYKKHSCDNVLDFDDEKMTFYYPDNYLENQSRLISIFIRPIEDSYREGDNY